MTPRLDGLRIVRVAPEPHASTIAHAMQSSADILSTSTPLKHEGVAWVRVVRIAGLDVVLKCRPLHTLRRRVQSRLAMGHAHRQWRGAARLTSAGLITAAPLLIARASVDGTPVELLALKHVPGRTLLEVLAAIVGSSPPSVRQQHAIAEAVGVMIRSMIAAKLSNRDSKPSNLIVVDQADAPANDTGVRIAVIDCVAIERRGWLDNGDELPAMLASLLLEPIGCNCPPRRTLWWRAIRAVVGAPYPSTPAQRLAMREHIELVEAIIAAHGNATPKIDPLSPSAL